MRKRLRLPDANSPDPYAHWMLREIYEQPAALAATLDRYVRNGEFRADTCGAVVAWIETAGAKIVIAASGSSRHAGLVGELLLEDLAGIAVDVEYASEFCCRTERAATGAALMVLSQSGETADTLAALRKAKLGGHATLAITNVAESTMARAAGASFATFAGREHAIPATKSFTAQLLIVYLLALMAAGVRGTLTAVQLKQRLAELEGLSMLIEDQLAGWEEEVRRIAHAYRDARNFLFLGRGVHYAIAREGALKLKESAYISAEGYPAGELKHGPNALVTGGTPLLMIATVDRSDVDSVLRYDKVLQLMRDMREQGADIFALANTGDTAVAALATHTVFITEAREPLLSLCEVIPLQLFAYSMAVQSRIDVDHPRNLTKAVLAE